MNKRRRSFGFALVISIIILTATGQYATAQSIPIRATEPQPFFYPAPTDSFDPVNASDTDLAAFGFPRRPPLESAAYTKWVTRMRNVKRRILNPIAQTTNIQHGGAAGSRALVTGGGAVSNGSDSFNWSGALASGVSGWFSANASYIDIAFQVPTVIAPQTDTSCQYGPYETSIWGGIDGWYQFPGANDVLQAGVNIGAAGSGSCSLFYSAWYEWWTSQCTTSGNPSLPCYQTNVNLSINPGDYMYIVVTYSTTSPNGSAFISDQSTGDYVSVTFNEPPPINSITQYQGYNAEWIVERPSIGGSVVNLANYRGNAGPTGTEVWLDADYSDNTIYGGAYAIGYGPESTITVLDMTCPPWNPSSLCSIWGPDLSVGVYYPPNPNGGFYGVFAYPAGPVIHQ